jgi:hypothetical protein
MESENLSTLKNVDRRAWKNQAFSAEAVPVSVLPFYLRGAKHRQPSLSAMNLSAAEFDSSEFVSS